MKLYPELRHGVFMDEDAQIVVQEAIAWINNQLTAISAPAQTSKNTKSSKSTTAAEGKGGDDPMDPKKPLGTPL